MIFFLSPLSTSDSPHSLFLISFLTSLSPINSLSFHQINSLADPSPIVDLLVIGFFSGFFPHRQFVGCLIFFWFFPIADLLVARFFLVFSHRWFVGCWLFFCCGGQFLLGYVGSNWSLVSIMCGFRLFRWWLCGCFGCFRSVSDDRVWVVLGLWERWHC